MFPTKEELDGIGVEISDFSEHMNPVDIWKYLESQNYPSYFVESELLLAVVCSNGEIRYRFKDKKGSNFRESIEECELDFVKESDFLRVIRHLNQNLGSYIRVGQNFCLEKVKAFLTFTSEKNETIKILPHDDFCFYYIEPDEFDCCIPAEELDYFLSHPSVDFDPIHLAQRIGNDHPHLEIFRRHNIPV